MFMCSIDPWHVVTSGHSSHSDSCFPLCLFVMYSCYVTVARQPHEQNRIPLCSEGEAHYPWSARALSFSHGFTACTYRPPLCSLPISNISKHAQPVTACCWLFSHVVREWGEHLIEDEGRILRNKAWHSFPVIMFGLKSPFCKTRAKLKRPCVASANKTS